MAKRKRRERDRPKAGPEAVYNPNKRVLLSYASDDEQETGAEEAAGVAHTAAVESIPTDYAIAPYPEDESDDCTNNGEDAFAPGPAGEAEGDSREAEAEADNDTPRPPKFNHGPRPNALTGQRTVLGAVEYSGNEDGDEEAEYDSEDAEAMAYLNAVRSEREALPTVFQAPHPDENEELYESGVGDSRGWLADGAYVARPEIGVTMPESAKTRIDPQEAYTLALKARLLTQRELLHASPAIAALADLGEQHPISLPEGSNKAYSEWHKLVRTTPPLPAQVQSMDVETVARLLQLIQVMYLVRGKYISSLTSAWIWSLLARLDDVGTMDNDAVYTMREFGKRAVLVQLSFSDPVAAEQLEAMDEDAVAAPFDRASLDNGEPTDGEAADSSASALEPDSTTGTQNTLATLDMIITIVGEVFGQRDLLEFRRPWEAAESGHEMG